MLRNRHLLLMVVFVALTVGVGAGSAYALTRGPSSPTASALTDQSSAVRAPTGGALDLASAVGRWNAENSVKGPGAPILGLEHKLLSDVGTAGDTVEAFPTAKGAVCFEIKAAGSCGSLSPYGVTWAIFATPNNTRVFGVAADDVTKVAINVHGLLHTATLANNAYYYNFSGNIKQDQVIGITVTTTDGSSKVIAIN